MGKGDSITTRSSKCEHVPDTSKKWCLGWRKKYIQREDLLRPFSIILDKVTNDLCHALSLAVRDKDYRYRAGKKRHCLGEPYPRIADVAKSLLGNPAARAFQQITEHFAELQETSLESGTTFLMPAK